MRLLVNVYKVCQQHLFLQRDTLWNCILGGGNQDGEANKRKDGRYYEGKLPQNITDWMANDEMRSTFLFFKK